MLGATQAPRDYVVWYDDEWQCICFGLLRGQEPLNAEPLGPGKPAGRSVGALGGQSLTAKDHKHQGPATSAPTTRPCARTVRLLLWYPACSRRGQGAPETVEAARGFHQRRRTELCRGTAIAEVRRVLAEGRTGPLHEMQQWMAWVGAWRLEVVGVWPRKRGKLKEPEYDFVMPRSVTPTPPSTRPRRAATRRHPRRRRGSASRPTGDPAKRFPSPLIPAFAGIQ